MFGIASEEIEVNVAANEAWKVFGTLQIARLMIQHHPEITEKMEVLEGNGGSGTLIQIKFPSGDSYCKERFNMVDDEKRIKTAELVEGGYLDLGFNFYKVRIEVIENEKDENSCTIRYTVEYEVKEEEPANASYFTMHPYVLMMNIGAQYLTKKKNQIIIN